MLIEKNQPETLVPRQSCFVKNYINNEPIHNSNLQSYKRQRSNFLESLKGKTFGEKSLQKNSLSIRKSYGSLKFNYEDKVELNNRGSVQDNFICSDVIVKNEKKKKDFILSQSSKRNFQEKQLKKYPVNVNLYNQYLKTEEITDAYYFVDQQVNEAKKREKKNQQTIKKVKSLSRSKSKEQAILFRNQEQLNFNCIKHVEQLRQMYSKIIVPQIMGTEYQSHRISPTSDKNIQSLKTTDTFKNHQNGDNDTSFFNGRDSRNLFKSASQSQKGFWKSKKFTQSLSTYKTSDFKNSEQKLPLYTARKSKEVNQQLKESINSDPLMKKLQKCKSTQDFMQKERVKIIKQAFIENWRQGLNKRQQKYLKIYPCKYTEKINKEKMTNKKNQQRHKKEQMYGQKYFKQNLIQKVSPVIEGGDMRVQRFNTLKEYQLQFEKISKNNIKSCVVTKR